MLQACAVQSGERRQTHPWRIAQTKKAGGETGRGAEASIEPKNIWQASLPLLHAEGAKKRISVWSGGRVRA